LQQEIDMSGYSRIASVLVLMLPALTIAWAPATQGADLLETETIVLVARPQLNAPLFGETILIAKPMGDGLHIGVILNRPANISLAETFPGHGLSSNVRGPLYLGGPFQSDVVFALVVSQSSSGRGSMQLSPDLFLVIGRDTVDHVIETEAENVRFFVGAVVWRPGELDEELKRGAWYVLDAEPEVVVARKTEGPWQRLVNCAEIREHRI
jgi:putative transcriptional regulator